LGDVLVGLSCWAKSRGSDVQAAHDRVMDKFRTRARDRWTRKEEQS
ncbi:MazG nucleotide pyrophosphohydrolase domain-containing protein, partial [Geobacillus stearothermophilus]|nr:MazG nucleotide pyrophosphohydrolase domain-containing protein [Geobacillus stearothermophilus]